MELDATGKSRPAVLYARVSSKEQELGFSILAQEQLLDSYAAQKNLTPVRFSDVETSLQRIDAVLIDEPGQLSLNGDAYVIGID